ncbi:hypothetical protein OIDMADRAFT_177567 [Oidiodendron maius Zn]|uniref:Fungal N-terminal domain-containing protein n=1 Tax=Oidiodendron maius (strain Zn) TaxID=913774 RepID=A0A0C3D297_OIDMZ|nr:hypothetical protein OIDMADRAFT_177567 [Oidiodendron maius Zn]
MSLPACVSCQERLSCADSALSITGNVIGILTFVGAAIISIQVYLNSIRNATQEIFIMMHRLQSRIAEVQQLQYLLEIENDVDRTLKEMLAFDIQRASKVLVESNDLLNRVTRSGINGKRTRFLTGVKFIYRADDLKRYTGELDDALDMIRGGVIAALLQVVFTSAKRTEECLKQTAERTEE